jgi:HupE / UreJ protein
VSSVVRSNLLSRLAVAVALAAILTPGIGAHEVPNEVTVLTFLKPEGRTLTMLMRVPLKSMRDVEVPTRENGFLDFTRVDQALRDAAALWIIDFVELYEGNQRLGKPRVLTTRVSLPSDRSFETYDQALEHVTKAPRLPDDTQIYWEQGMLDIAFEYDITSDQADFSIRPGLTRLGLQVNVGLRFLQPNGPERVFDVHADTGIVHLDPSWYQAFYLFAREGFFHILDGIDHLLFLLCLVVPFRRFRPLVVVVTAFTVAHSITLIASAFGMAPDALWFPPLIETLIALSIVYMAFENIVGARLERRWIITFAFGLVHGFGFSFLLSQRLQFAGSHLLSSLLAFNVGVEIGQLLVLLIAIPALALLFKFVVEPRIGTILISALVAHTAWHWMIDRGGQLLRFPFPVIDAAAIAAILRWMMVIVAAAGGLWLISGVVKRWEGAELQTKKEDRGKKTEGVTA